jgi:hypothetical protein
VLFFDREFAVYNQTPAYSKSGPSNDLGTKTIAVDIAHAIKSFGTLDTPGQGGTASGSAFVNFGWALTPNPNKIPIDGSTLSVIIDGQAVGQPTYNQFRSDIASLFPGYLNSGGAVGFFYIDTTKLTNGGEGIGSRYFTVFNNGSSTAPEEFNIELNSTTKPGQPEHIRNRAATVRERIPDNRSIEIEEVGQLELPLYALSGYQLINGERRPLPIGSSLNRGVVYWQPGPGFLGEHNPVFVRKDGTESHLHVRINPKTYPAQPNEEN